MAPRTSLVKGEQLQSVACSVVIRRCCRCLLCVVHSPFTRALVEGLILVKSPADPRGTKELGCCCSAFSGDSMETLS